MVILLASVCSVEVAKKIAFIVQRVRSLNIKIVDANI